MRLARSRKTWLGVAAVAVVAFAIWCAWVIAGSDDAEDDETIAGLATTVTVAPTPLPKPPQAPVEPALPARIVIPGIDVDAPVSVKGMTPGKAMQPPDGPEDVAWYDFTARPGSGGNAVFSAHVDYHDYGPAVFARLKDLEQGDTVEVRLADATVYRYRVVLSVVYPAGDAPVDFIVGATSRETITLITCTGSFDATTRQYSHRLIVRAERA
jgi:LPXTG-site transpeptidase (sortase) family protein